MISCGISEGLNHHDSDHKPIRTTISLVTIRLPPQERRQWKHMDIGVFLQTLEQGLPTAYNLTNTEEIDTFTRQIVSVLTTAIETSTPMAYILHAQGQSGPKIAKTHRWRPGDERDAMGEPNQTRTGRHIA
jgi:hypothetical protein